MTDLPEVVLLEIFKKLPKHAGILRKVCSKWRALLKDWKKISTSSLITPALFNLAASEWGLQKDMALRAACRNVVLLPYCRARFSPNNDDVWRAVCETDSVPAAQSLTFVKTEAHAVHAALNDAVGVLSWLWANSHDAFDDCETITKLLCMAASGDALTTFQWMWGTVCDTEEFRDHLRWNEELMRHWLSRPASPQTVAWLFSYAGFVWKQQDLMRMVRHYFRLYKKSFELFDFKGNDLHDGYPCNYLVEVALEIEDTEECIEAVKFFAAKECPITPERLSSRPEVRDAIFNGRPR